MGGVGQADSRRDLFALLRKKKHVGAFQLFPLLEPSLLLLLGWEEVPSTGRDVGTHMRFLLLADLWRWQYLQRGRGKLPGRVATMVPSSITSCRSGRSGHCVFPAGHGLTQAKGGKSCYPPKEAAQEQLNLHSALQRKRWYWTTQVGYKSQLHPLGRWVACLGTQQSGFVLPAAPDPV